MHLIRKTESLERQSLAKEKIQSSVSFLMLRLFQTAKSYILNDSTLTYLVLYSWIPLPFREKSFFIFCLFRATPMAYGNMEVPRLGTESELHHSYSNARSQLICDLYSSSGQCQILNLLSKARDWTHILMDISWVCFCWTTMGTPERKILISDTLSLWVQ